MIGNTLAHYRIIEKLGEGGMGVVYKALDTHLDRFVALKLLPPDRLSDAERQRRFVQEAKAASALNHPNIIHVYDIPESDRTHFIAMEYVAGKTLDQVARHKGLPVNEALKYAVQIADALAKAHSAGIVHRDLKPSNIMVTGDGLIKILDFGLAKLMVPAETDEFAETAPINNGPQTEEGAIVGTVSYMSPEQAQGKKVDARSDIFSFGAVLYEMLTGRRAFQRETRLLTLTAITRDEPAPISDVAGIIPHELERIIARCLRKDPERRFQNAADLKVALQEVKEESESGKLAGAPVVAPPRRRVFLPLLALGAVLLLAAAAAIWLLSRKAPQPNVGMVITRLTSDSGLTTEPAISPDGKLVAYASDRGSEDNLDIWVQQVAGGAPMRLTTNPADDHQPAFSPDGSRIAFRSERDSGGIYVISTLGGEERLIARNGAGPSFSPDGNWIAYHVGGGLRTSRIYTVSATGGPPRELKLQIPWAGNAIWSPDGKYLMFVGTTDPSGISSLDWWVAPAEGGQAIKTGASTRFEHSGLSGVIGFPSVWRAARIVFFARLGDATNLWQVAINPKAWQINDPPQRLTTGAGQELFPSMSADGRLVFMTGGGHLALWMLAMENNRAKVQGKPEQLTRSGDASLRPSLSSDGRKLAFLSSRSGTSQVWIKDMPTGKESALTSTSANETHMVIAPDGSKVGYASSADGKHAIYLMPIGKGVAEKLCENCGLPLDWSPDGKRVLYHWGRPVRYNSIDIVTRQTVEVIQHPAYNLHRARFSPEGNWLAFHVPLVTEQGRSPIFIAPLGNGVAPGEKEWIQVTDGEGIDAAPWWSPDGNILYFLSNRDGFQCMWAQHLNKATKRPVGGPFDVAHFHGSRHKVQEAGFGPAIGANKLIFTLSESTANIWMAKMEANHD